MLKLDREEDVHEVLGKAKEIRTIGRAKAHNIFFAPDMTKLGRQENQTLRSEHRD